MRDRGANMVFIGGMARSGTALVMHLLNLWRGCHIGDECDLSQEQLQDLWTNTPSDQLAGNKSPAYSVTWPHLRALFPACRLVMTDRDVEAAVASAMRQEWAPATIEDCRATLTAQREAALSCPDALVVRLEELEADPLGQLRRLLEFVEIPLDEYDMATAEDAILWGNVNRTMPKARPEDVAGYVTDMATSYTFGYPSGVFDEVCAAGWTRPATLFEQTRLSMPVRSGSACEEHRWLLPLVAATDQLQLQVRSVVDVGCGLSLPMAHYRLHDHAEPLLGLDMSPCPSHYYPPRAVVQRCNLMDLCDVRRAVADPTPYHGCLLVVSEVLEHLEWSPLPLLTLLVERLRPAQLYLSAPTFLEGGFRRDWCHYSELPSWRGQPVRMAPWHFKGWTDSEFADLVYDLGLTVRGTFAGYHRCGVFAVGEACVR